MQRVSQLQARMIQHFLLRQAAVRYNKEITVLGLYTNKDPACMHGALDQAEL